MQNEMEIKTQMLENELNSTRKKLEDTEIKLSEVIQEKKKIIEQKDEKIEELNQKVKNIQVSFEFTFSLLTFILVCFIIQTKWSELAKRAHVVSEKVDQRVREDF